VITVHLKIKFSGKNLELVKYLMTLGYEVYLVEGQATVEIPEANNGKERENKFILPRELRRRRREIVIEKNDEIKETFCHNNGSVTTVEVKSEEEAAIKEYTFAELEGEEVWEDAVSIIVETKIIWSGSVFESLPEKHVRYFNALNESRASQKT
jgi:hypothetical protein